MKFYYFVISHQCALSSCCFELYFRSPVLPPNFCDQRFQNSMYEQKQALINMY